MAFSPTLTSAKVADPSQLLAYAKRFNHAALVFSAGFKTLKPEFGAYMLYSLWQEVGLVSKNFPARPHILPAVMQSSGIITKAMLDYQLNFVKATVGNISGGGGSAANQTRALETAWLRVLNGPVRVKAVDLAKSLGVWDYGFHARSIHGYAYARDPASIKADAQSAHGSRAAKKGSK